MGILPNYPNYSQLSAKINPLYDCVPGAIKDGVKFLTGEELDLDAMVTAVYGPNWHGATSASRYVAFCATHGVHLYPIDGPPVVLVQDLHGLIQAEHPCLLTEPDVYAPAHPDWSHVLSVYGEAPGMLLARDPFSTHDVEHPDSVWASILEFREIWVMEELVTPLTIDMPEVAALFRQIDANHWQDTATGYILQDAMLADYRANGMVSLERLGHVVSKELVQPNRDAIQHYQFGGRMWIAATGRVVSLDLYAAGSPGVDPRIAQLQAQLVAVQNQPAAPQSTALLLQIAEEAALAVGKKLV